MSEITRHRFDADPPGGAAHVWPAFGPEAQPEARPEARLEARLEARPDARPDFSPELRPDFQPEVGEPTSRQGTRRQSASGQKPSRREPGGQRHGRPTAPTRHAAATARARQRGAAPGRRRTARIALAAAVITAAGAAATLGAVFTPAVAVSQPVTVDSLALNTSAVAPGEKVHATAVLQAATGLRVQALTIAVRSASGGHFDFPGAVSTRLTKFEASFTPKARSFPAGTYTYFAAYEVRGTWHALSPVRSFTSGGADASEAPSASSTSGAAAPSMAPAASASASASASTGGGAGTASSSPPAAPASSSPAESHGTLVFDDEFDGSGIDSSKWSTNWLGSSGAVTPPINSNETGCYDPKQAAESGGELDLTAVASSCGAGGRTYAYRSGIVESDGKFSFTHGYAEARIWTPAGTGMWPAFWLDGQSWPTDGEIDVLESDGTDYSSYHYHYPGGGPGGGVDLPGATAGWHTYAVDWTSGTTTWFYDGKQVYQMATQTNSPMYLILNLGLDSNASAVPATMRVDYVRVWQ